MMKKSIVWLFVLAIMSVQCTCKNPQGKPEGCPPKCEKESKSCCPFKKKPCEKECPPCPEKECKEKKCGCKECKFQEFKEKRMAFMVEEAGLTPEEAEKALALYDQMREGQMSKDCEMHEKVKSLMCPKKQSTEKDYATALNEMLDFSLERVNAERAFYTELQKIVSSEKALKFRFAEERFLRHHIKGMKGKCPKDKPKE